MKKVKNKFLELLKNKKTEALQDLEMDNNYFVKYKP